MRLGSGAGKFTGYDFLAFRFGKIGMGSPCGGKAGIPCHEPKPLGDSPLLCEAHLAEALDLYWMQWFNHFGSMKS
jgi:hypothetical protein